MHIAGFFVDFTGTVTRESVIGGPIETEDTKSPVYFAVLIHRYGSNEHEGLAGYAYFYTTPSLQHHSHRLANAMRITSTHPALVLGQKVKNSTAITESLCILAESTERSLTYIIHGWRQYCTQKNIPHSEPFPTWIIVFGLLVQEDSDEVTIVAHHPASRSLEEFDSSPVFTSVVMEKIPFHCSVHNRHNDGWRFYNDIPEDTPWMVDRLRLGMAFLVILNNARRILGLWDELRWDHETLMREEEEDKQFAEWKWRTPNPSETGIDVWAESLRGEELEEYEWEQERLEAKSKDVLEPDTVVSDSEESRKALPPVMQFHAGGCVETESDRLVWCLKIAAPSYVEKLVYQYGERVPLSSAVINEFFMTHLKSQSDCSGPTQALVLFPRSSPSPFAALL
ncbi:hypothetical protein M422DRAFT_254867 [Sphaerobolus stellatus SS14]|uniref:Uncharacterized protein n=1 Tax=Sphaerobolus stellatus (strain SS14) TaxID=990650 RepID=A0A0C9VUC1_SPHS4|nr:hypothetical protein M422DRAFT_254867 [Sphaerobolus stellatus SS14]